jgi:oligoribonuclease NrnB/cAMP/cGMP phosphodiesterase (DHH superfamily)
MKVFFHNDLDGRCSAAIIYIYKIKATGIRGCEFIEADYKDPINVDNIRKNEEVIIVDFSFKPEVMDAVSKKTGYITWIDHHATAKDYPYNNFINGKRDFRDKMNAACELTWKYIVAAEPVPEAIQLLGDYDKWALKFAPRCFQFYEGLKLANTEPKAKIWEMLLETDQFFAKDLVNEIVETGDTCIKYRNNYCNDMIKSYGYEIDVYGHKGFAVNLYRFGSQGFGDLLKKYNFVASYVFDGTNYSLSFYSEIIDVSALAKKLGEEKGAISAGGHKGAAGMVIKNLPFAKR